MASYQCHHTFTPAITAAGKAHQHLPLQDRSQKVIEERARRLERSKAELEAGQKKDMTFAPRINTANGAGWCDKENVPPAHERLYKRAREREAEKEQERAREERRLAAQQQQHQVKATPLPASSAPTEEQKIRRFFRHYASAEAVPVMGYAGLHLCLCAMGLFNSFNAKADQGYGGTAIEEAKKKLTDKIWEKMRNYEAANGEGSHNKGVGMAAFTTIIEALLTQGAGGPRGQEQAEQQQQQQHHPRHSAPSTPQPPPQPQPQHAEAGTSRALHYGMPSPPPVPAGSPPPQPTAAPQYAKPAAAAAKPPQPVPGRREVSRRTSSVGPRSRVSEREALNLNPPSRCGSATGASTASEVSSSKRRRPPPRTASLQRLATPRSSSVTQRRSSSSSQSQPHPAPAASRTASPAAARRTVSPAARRAAREQVVPQAERDIEQCTFHPQVHEVPHGIYEAPVSQAPGFSRAVERMAKGREATRKKFDEDLRSSTPSRRSTGPTTVKPFRFQTERRERVKPLLYVDVNLGGGRMGRIGIHTGDKVETLAANFAQAYGLDGKMRVRLEGILAEQISKAVPKKGDTQQSPAASARQTKKSPQASRHSSRSMSPFVAHTSGQPTRATPSRAAPPLAAALAVLPPAHTPPEAHKEQQAPPSWQFSTSPPKTPQQRAIPDMPEWETEAPAAQPQPDARSQSHSHRTAQPSEQRHLAEVPGASFLEHEALAEEPHRQQHDHHPQYHQQQQQQQHHPSPLGTATTSYTPAHSLGVTAPDTPEARVVSRHAPPSPVGLQASRSPLQQQHQEHQQQQPPSRSSFLESTQGDYAGAEPTAAAAGVGAVEEVRSPEAVGGYQHGWQAYGVPQHRHDAGQWQHAGGVGVESAAEYDDESEDDGAGGSDDADIGFSLVPDPSALARMLPGDGEQGWAHAAHDAAQDEPAARGAGRSGSAASSIPFPESRGPSVQEERRAAHVPAPQPLVDYHLIHQGLASPDFVQPRGGIPATPGEGAAGLVPYTTTPPQREAVSHILDAVRGSAAGGFGGHAYAHTQEF